VAVISTFAVGPTDSLIAELAIGVVSPAVDPAGHKHGAVAEVRTGGRRSAGDSADRLRGVVAKRVVGSIDRSVAGSRSPERHGGGGHTERPSILKKLTTRQG